jgi:hypothetical protein
MRCICHPILQISIRLKSVGLGSRAEFATSWLTSIADAMQWRMSFPVRPNHLESCYTVTREEITLLQQLKLGKGMLQLQDTGSFE